MPATPAATAHEKPRRRLPILQGILPIDRSRISIDVIAGITLAALAIPEVMGYTKIAGMPVVTGLYTILIPMALFALFGSSRHLVVGADSATAAIMAAGLTGLAAHCLAAVRRLRRHPGPHGGRLPDPCPHHPAGLHRGFPLPHRVDRLPDRRRHPGGDRADIGHAGHSRRWGRPGPETGHRRSSSSARPIWYTVAVSIGVLVVIVGSRKINKKIPGALIAVIGAIVVSYVVNLSGLWRGGAGHSPGWSAALRPDRQA